MIWSKIHLGTIPIQLTHLLPDFVFAIDILSGRTMGINMSIIYNGGVERTGFRTIRGQIKRIDHGVRWHIEGEERRSIPLKSADLEYRPRRKYLCQQSKIEHVFRIGSIPLSQIVTRRRQQLDR